MKLKTIFVILTAMLLIQSKSHSQENALNKNTTFTVPEGFEKQTRPDNYAMAKSNQINVAELPKELNKLTYIYQNISVTLSSSDNPQKADLEKLKKGIDELSKGISTYSSKIIDVNGNSVLLIDDTAGMRITFYASNASVSSLVNGLIEFNKEDRKKALDAVQTVLKNIKFKK